MTAYHGRNAWFVCAVALAVAMSSAQTSVATQSTSTLDIEFVRDVVPILREKCIVCHGPRANEGGLRLDTRVEMLRGGKSGPAISEQDAPNSLLIKKIIGSAGGLRMPPTGALADDEIAIVRGWVSEGAPWDAGASFFPVREVFKEAERLFEALRVGDLATLRSDLAEDPELIHSLDADGSGLLTLAAYWAGAAEVKELLERGADPNAKNDAGMAALIPATDTLEKTRLLVEAGADVDARTNDGDTALIVAAARTGSAPVVAYLLENGADVSAATKAGFTAMHRAATSGDVDTLKTLLDRGADIDAISKNGRTPLLTSAIGSRLPAFRYLLSRNADPKLGRGAAITRFVARSGDLEIMKALLAGGLDLSDSKRLNTALLWACESYTANPAVVKLLLDRGADPQAKAQDGDTPLGLARQRGYAEIVELLDRAISEKLRATGGGS